MTGNEFLEKMEIDSKLNKLKEYEEIGTVEQFKRSVREEDVLKFYRVDSINEYVIGQRCNTLYYAQWQGYQGGFIWTSSRYLPWGEAGMPSEPVEIDFNEWMRGLLCKYTAAPWKNMNEENEDE